MIRSLIQGLILINGVGAWEYGVIVGVYEAKQEADIDTLTEPRDNPFKFGNTEVKPKNHESLEELAEHNERRY
jgi:hypothetical protein